MSIIFKYKTKAEKESQERSSTSQLSPLSSGKAALRKKLSSIVWVQCDNHNCLKWRKLRKDLAKEITEVKWTCDMNEDPYFKSCDVPEEDTYSYDRLAKKAKLDLIKSDLEPGTLVWAKVSGYCRWPAIITADPLNGLHADGDDFEMIWYHVEFLGGSRTHVWVKTNNIEVFGPGNVVDSASVKQSGQGKKIKKRKSSVGCATRKRKDKMTCKGAGSVTKAIAEAMDLLSLSCEERLKTCWFVNEEDLKKKTWTLMSDNRTAEKHSLHKDAKLSKVLGSRHSDDQNELGKCKNAVETNCKKNRKSQIRKHGCFTLNQNKTENGYTPVLNKKLSLACLDFQTSLLNTSKEERFILDLQRYVKNEKAFENDFSRFMLHSGSKLALKHTWHNGKISLFNLFLAVNEREGYLKVCERHEWSSVYADASQHNCKNGGSQAKQLYKKNLYHFELHVKGLNYSHLLKEADHYAKQMPVNIPPLDDGCILDLSINNDLSSEEDEDFDNPDLIQQLNELDQILKSLENDESVTGKVEDSVVPDSCRRPNSPVLNAVTGSFFGDAAEPEEKAQVVPELDFPSSIESSQSGNEQIYHEMQALQHDMAYIQEELDIL
ncbi:Zinc finger CW-type PWWP domain protein 1 [Bulinus truncatus]|nr:Zinc finger CW-type PWWP domain protein 1 [Bulinus truncatus]